MFQSRNESSEGGGRNMKICCNYNKQGATAGPQKSLMVCSNCKKAYYCSRECQREDWKSHKHYCIAPDDEKLAKSR